MGVFSYEIGVLCISYAVGRSPDGGHILDSGIVRPLQGRVLHSAVVLQIFDPDGVVVARIKYVYSAEKIELFRHQPTTEINPGLRKNCVKINVEEGSKNEINVTLVWIST